jgi:hypothetical protein
MFFKALDLHYKTNIHFWVIRPTLVCVNLGKALN